MENDKNAYLGRMLSTYSPVVHMEYKRLRNYWQTPALYQRTNPLIWL